MAGPDPTPDNQDRSPIDRGRPDVERREIRTLLIANRGEIARRVIRTARN